MNAGGTTDLGGFTVSLVRADHSSGDVVNGVPIYLGNPCGVVVKAAGEPTVYHMGDTDIFPIWAWSPKSISRGTFPIIEATPDKFVVAMKGHATKVLVPEKGKPQRV
jgi:hypothetical protein